MLARFYITPGAPAPFTCDGSSQQVLEAAKAYYRQLSEQEFETLSQVFRGGTDSSVYVPEEASAKQALIRARELNVFDNIWVMHGKGPWHLAIGDLKDGTRHVIVAHWGEELVPVDCLIERIQANALRRAKPKQVQAITDPGHCAFVLAGTALLLALLTLTWMPGYAIAWWAMLGTGYGTLRFVGRKWPSLVVLCMSTIAATAWTLAYVIMLTTGQVSA